MQLDERSGKLRSVESLNAAGWSLRKAEGGRVVFGCQSIQRVVVASCCKARVVRNSESLHGLDAALLERCGRQIDIPVLTVRWVKRGGCRSGC